MRNKDQIFLENIYSGILKTGKCLECGCTLTCKDVDDYKNFLLKEENESGVDCNGVVVYHGVSNGENIVAIATGIVRKSTNAKTGPMVQIWVLHADVSPVEAIESGRDVGVCGNCIHRKGKGGACYVNIGKAPSQVFSSFKKGNYPYIVNDIKVFEGGDITAAYLQHGLWDTFKNSYVRFGAYGDPSFIPFEILEKIAQNCQGFTGYTHQWKSADSRYQKYLMASVDFPEEYNKAKDLGWKTFRVTPDWKIKDKNEIPCVNATKGIQCIDCLLCGGTSKPGKDIYIKVHGATAKRFVEIYGTDRDNFDYEITDSDKRFIEMAETREKEDKKKSPLQALRKNIGIK